MERRNMGLIGFRAGVPPDAASNQTGETVVIWNASVAQPLEGATRVACLKDGIFTFYPNVIAELETVLLDGRVTKVFHNVAESLSRLRQEGIQVNNVQCLSLMAKVLGERYMDLNYLALKYLEGEFLHTDSRALKSGTQQLEVTTKCIHRLYRVLRAELIGQGLFEVYHRENRANAIIPRLNCDGVLFRFDEWDKYLDSDRDEISELEASIKSMLNAPNLDLTTPAQLMESLHRAEIPLHSLSDESLSACENLHPVIPMIKRYRKKSRKIRTFGTDLKRHLGCDGRLRGSWNILGCKSGRMSCGSPPLQAMPGISKSFFQPDNGNIFVIGDYSQIELRMLAEISGDETLRKQFLDGADLHSGTAALIYQKSVHQVTQEERQVGKNLNFGVVYGIKEYGIRKSLLKHGVDISLDEAAHLRGLFLKSYSKVAMMQNVLLKATVIKTLGGRSWDSSKLTLAQRLNLPIQGSAAEGLKEALSILNMQMKDNWKLCAVVHDEVLLEVPESDVQEAETILEQSMVRGMKKFIASIPVVVETTINNEWNKKEG